MRRLVYGPLPLIAFVAGLGACITVNIYFPAPEVRAAAEQIVEETWGGEPVGTPGEAPGGTAPVPGDRSSRSIAHWLARAAGALGPRAAMAADAPDINVSTAAIRALKKAMSERAAILKPYLASGNVGIGSDGMLVLRDPAGLAMRDRATVSRLVEAENADRKSLYEAIAKANDFGEDRVPDIQAIFAETWVEKAEPGWWVQEPNVTGSAWRRVGGP